MGVDQSGDLGVLECFFAQAGTPYTMWSGQKNKALATSNVVFFPRDFCVEKVLKDCWSGFLWCHEKKRVPSESNYWLYLKKLTFYW